MNYTIATFSDEESAKNIDSAKKILKVIGQKYSHDFVFSDCVIDVACEISNKVSKAKKANAVLYAVDKSNRIGSGSKIAKALSDIQNQSGTYAMVQPVKFYSSLSQSCPLKDDILQKGIDIEIVYDVAGGIYHSERGYRFNDKFGREAFDTERYSELEIERTARIAYEIAAKRNRKIALVDKADMLTTSRLWRKIVTDVNEDYPDVRLDLICIDEMMSQLVLEPSQFDVILTSNLFGDVLSGITHTLCGCATIVPSAILGDTTFGMYGTVVENPFRNSDISNPIGAILACSMLLRHSLDMLNEAAAIENAVENSLSDGCLTFDLGGNLSATEITDEIIKRL